MTDDRLIDIVAQLPQHPTERYAQRLLSAITHIVIHHAAAETGPWEWARYHIDHHGWPGIAYSAVVMRDGRAYKTQNDNTISYHAGSGWNPVAIGICLQGDLTKNPPTGPQVAKTLLIVRRYARAYGIPAAHIIGHAEATGGTACPGAPWVVEWLKGVLA